MKRPIAITICMAFIALVGAVGITSGRAQAGGGWYDCLGNAVYDAVTGTCSDHSIPRFHPDLVTPGPAPSTIRLFVPQMVHPMTLAQQRALDAQLQRQAKALAKKWSRNGRLNAMQLRAIQDQTCFLVAASNPDVRCVPQP